MIILEVDILREIGAVTGKERITMEEEVPGLGYVYILALVSRAE